MAYEISAYQINEGWLGESRTGVDLLLKTLLNSMKVHAGFALLMPAFFLIWLVVKEKKTIAKFTRKPVRFAFMLLESLSYALMFGLVVGFISAIFLSDGNANLNQTKVAAFVVHLGSGVYEEFFFRFILLTVLVMGMQYFFSWRSSVNYSIAIVISSLLFAYSHHLEIFNEPLDLQSLVFRFLAGVAFSVLFIFRGIGVTAYTHSLYNILLLFRQT